MDTIPSKKIRFRILQKLSEKHSVSFLCNIAGVSLSGYYKQKKQRFLRQTKEYKERLDLELIRELSVASKQKHGYRIITMKLQKEGNSMNHKKVLRIMGKYDLLAKVRRKNPYRLIQKATQEHRTAPNILNREFRTDVPYRKLGTDITYIPYRDQWSYLSIIKDMASGEILSWDISLRLGLDVVQQTLQKLEAKYTNNELSGACIQSDQGFHYTHPSYSKQLLKMGCVQSMSRKGNCLDNAPTESFFGHMKDEIDTSECKTLEELEKYMDFHIQYYNNERPQWTRKKMTPVEYRNHLLQLQS